MKEVMIPKIPLAFISNVDRNKYAHEFARGWAEGRCLKGE